METNLAEEREKRKRRRISYIARASFRHYIRKILLSFNNDVRISDTSVEIIDAIIFDLFHQLASGARDLMITSGKRMLMTRDIQYAVMRYFKGELARRVVIEGNKAIQIRLDLRRR